MAKNRAERGVWDEGKMCVPSYGTLVLPPPSEAAITEKETSAPPKMANLIYGSDSDSSDVTV